MPAYVISELEVRDAVAIETYRSIAAKSIAQYGGRYLVRNGAASVVEGGPLPNNIVVVEFPSMARLREWYASPEYAEALKVRRTALDRRLIFVEGVLRATTPPARSCRATCRIPAGHAPASNWRH
jgi:uncharacterized protein (DUF1330 family)